jgi:holo-ACP synthase CitX
LRGSGTKISVKDGGKKEFVMNVSTIDTGDTENPIRRARRLSPNKQRIFATNASVSALLDAREKRWRRRLALSEQGTLLTLTLNLPGPDKRLPRWLEFYDSVQFDLQRALTIGNFTFTRVSSHVTASGPEDHFIVTAEALTLKRAMVDFEESHPGGRLVDLDVMTCGKPIGREVLGLPPRSCLCCPRPAKECAAAARHTLDEVLRAAERILEVSL